MIEQAWRRAATIAPGDFIRRWKKARSTAVEWIGPYDDEKLGFSKIAKYYYYPGWWEGGANAHLLINRAKWESLSKTYQTIVTTSAREAGMRMTAKYDFVNPPAMTRLIASRHPAASLLAGDHGGIVQGRQ